jgi:hypothetical protein
MVTQSLVVKKQVQVVKWNLVVTLRELSPAASSGSLAPLGPRCPAAVTPRFSAGVSVRREALS